MIAESTSSLVRNVQQYSATLLFGQLPGGHWLTKCWSGSEGELKCFELRDSSVDKQGCGQISCHICGQPAETADNQALPKSSTGHRNNEMS